MGTLGRSEESRKAMEEKLILSNVTANVPEPPDVFHFWNGDEYTGQISTKDKQKIVMEGIGTYKASDGETYEGIWENDSLKEAFKITYRDKSVFSGSLEEMAPEGRCRYVFKENVEVEGEFVDGGLMGEVFLRDPGQHAWMGGVKSDQPFVLFLPVHPFWQSVLSLPSNVEALYGEHENEVESVSEISFNLNIR